MLRALVVQALADVDLSADLDGVGVIGLVTRLTQTGLYFVYGLMLGNVSFSSTYGFPHLISELLLSRPDWSAVGRGILLPTIPPGALEQAQASPHTGFHECVADDDSIGNRPQP